MNRFMKYYERLFIMGFWIFVIFATAYMWVKYVFPWLADIFIESFLLDKIQALMVH